MSGPTTALVFATAMAGQYYVAVRKRHRAQAYLVLLGRKLQWPAAEDSSATLKPTYAAARRFSSLASTRVSASLPYDVSGKLTLPTHT